MEKIPDEDSLLRELNRSPAEVLNKRFEFHHLALERSRRFLRRHDSRKVEMFTLFVDLGGSTRMASRLRTEVLARVIRFYSQAMAYAIELHGGYVLKYVGDAVIGYFPRHGSTGKTSQDVVGCAHFMLGLVRNVINPYFKKLGYPQLTIKVTADFGEVSVVRYGSDRRRSHMDIIGLSVNLAAKMQTLGRQNSLIVGKKVYQMLPAKSRHSFQRLVADSKLWPYRSLGARHPYPLYWERPGTSRPIFPP